MSSDWQTSTFAEAPFSVIDGDRGANYPKQHEFSRAGYCLFLNAGNVTQAGFVFSDCAFITEEKDSILRKGKLVRHDLVLTTRGTVGNVAYFADEVQFQHIRINSGMVILRPDQSRIDPYFLYLFLRSRNFSEQVAFLTSGSAQPQLPIRDMNRVEMPLPPLKDQRRICSTLRAIDDRITLLRETNANLETIAQALFKSWFVDFDPVRAKAEGLEPEGMNAATAALFPDSFEDSELGLVPRGWATRPIYDMASYINGAAYKAFEPNAERRGLPIIKIAELKAGVTLQTAFSDVTMPEKYLIKTGDILFSWSGNPDTSIDTFVWGHDPALLNQHIFRVLPHVQTDRSFVLQTLRNLKPVFAELARNKQTTGLGHVTVADLKRLHVVNPPRAVIEQFNNCVETVHQMIFGNEQQAKTLTLLRDTLLPRLISGQLRLPETETSVESMLSEAV